MKCTRAQVGTRPQIIDLHAALKLAMIRVPALKCRCANIGAHAARKAATIKPQAHIYPRLPRVESGPPKHLPRLSHPPALTLLISQAG